MRPDMVSEELPQERVGPNPSGESRSGTVESGCSGAAIRNLRPCLADPRGTSFQLVRALSDKLETCPTVRLALLHFAGFKRHHRIGGPHIGKIVRPVGV